MIEINVKEHMDFIQKYAKKQTIGGLSNLSNFDLKKASRESFQITGVAGEVSWYLYRYGNIDKLKSMLDYKFETLRPERKGDDGFDDSITYNNKTRFVDIKTSHTIDEDRIKYLNLIIPKREWHQNMIYIAAFTVGKDRENIDKVVLAGWKFNEYIHKKWSYDENKLCVPFSDLSDMKDLNEYIR